MRSTNQIHKLTGREIKGRVKTAIVLAGISLLLSVPIYMYNYQNYSDRIFTTIPGPDQIKLLAVGQSLIVFCAVIICALVGILYSDRLGLPGLTEKKDILKWVPFYLGAGILFAPAMYFFSDISILAHLPKLFPDEFLWALPYAVGSALNEELVGRLGLVTIALYFFRRRDKERSANFPIFFVSAILALSSISFLMRLDIFVHLTIYQVMQMALSKFVLNIIYGEIYVNKGLLPALVFHIGVNSRIVFYALTG